ncbi:cytochrome d ubiquinol oxidase subunit II [Oleispirillum naphthae]|uniref:cytochrome d ubiquinol oxidase subunit II n=1 Tax=Oleispirillum naphthae TaxID=2838853 RepID=UPI003082597A
MLFDLIDYSILRLLWWALLGVLLIGFAIMDGFDLGVATLLPFVARNDTERRIAINSIGPVWDGNQVWLVLGAGAIFAAWPPIYATAFSGFYIAMFLVLAALILRPVGFDFRNKLPSPRWRRNWDYALFIGGAVPSLVFGVAVGNVLLGVPFTIDADQRIFYEGSGLFELLNPFGLLAGIVSLTMLAAHGGSYLALKSDGPVRERARKATMLLAPVSAAFFILGGLWIASGISGYAITSPVDPSGPSNPLLKTVTTGVGLWTSVYVKYPAAAIAPLLGIAGLFGAALLAKLRHEGLAFIASAAGIAGVILTAGVSLFPFIMPSSLAPNASLTVWDSSSSHRTLFVMAVCALIFVPIVLGYTSFIFHVLRGKLTAQHIEKGNKSLY